MNKRTAFFATAFIVSVLFGFGCDTAERDAVTEPSPTVTPSMTPPETQPSPSAPPWLAAGATHGVAEITDASNAFIGKTVTVIAEVDDVHGPRAFTLEAEDEDSSLAKGDGKDLLTLIPKVGGFPNVDAQWEDDKARVTGVVQRMIVKDVEREIGWELPGNLKSRFRSRPVLIARSVERLVK
ncbi:MAG: hypothetical protein ACREA2_14390 [Blastocatellia bacterium]